MPKSAWPLSSPPSARWRLTQRSSQRCVRSVAAATAGRSAGFAGQWSKAMATSAPSARWISITRSGVQAHARAVDLGAEARAVVVDRALIAEAEDLVAARVGQDRPVPAHEAVQAAELRDDLLARAQVQVVGVGEHHLGAERAQRRRRDAAHRRARADGHEGRRLHLAVGRLEDPGAGARARGAVLYLEGETGAVHAREHTPGPEPGAARGSRKARRMPSGRRSRRGRSPPSRRR